MVDSVIDSLLPGPPSYDWEYLPEVASHHHNFPTPRKRDAHNVCEMPRGRIGRQWVSPPSGSSPPCPIAGPTSYVSPQIKMTVLLNVAGYHEQGVRSAGAGEKGGDPAACRHSARSFPPPRANRSQQRGVEKDLDGSPRSIDAKDIDEEDPLPCRVRGEGRTRVRPPSSSWRTWVFMIGVGGLTYILGELGNTDLAQLL